MKFGNSTGEFSSDAVIHDVVRGLDDVTIAITVWRIGHSPFMKHISTTTMTSSDTIDTTPYFSVFVHSVRLFRRVIDEVFVRHVIPIPELSPLVVYVVGEISVSEKWFFPDWVSGFQS